MHIVYDPDADRPVYFAVTPANVNDITAAKAMPIEPGATYVFDLGYYDYGWWAGLDEAGCRFVTRLQEEYSVQRGEGTARSRTATLSATASAICRPGSPTAARNPLQDPVREITVIIDTGKVLRIVYQ